MNGIVGLPDKLLNKQPDKSLSPQKQINRLEKSSMQDRNQMR